MRRRPRLVGLLWHWHRRLGVLAAVFVVTLVVTGIVLNHSSALGLDRRFVDNAWLSQAYGDARPQQNAFQLGGHWLSRASDGKVYLDTQAVAPCRGELAGAVEAGELLLAGCSEELLLLTRDGALVESVSASMGLPAPLQAIGLIDSRVAVQAAGVWRLADLERLEFTQPAPAGGAVIRQLAPGHLPTEIRARIPAPDRWLSYERLLLDVHSGRLFGRAGVLLVDGIGVLLVTLAASGTAMWWLHRRRQATR